jgi:hypothetical protein
MKAVLRLNIGRTATKAWHEDGNDFCFVFGFWPISEAPDVAGGCDAL